MELLSHEKQHRINFGVRQPFNSLGIDSQTNEMLCSKTNTIS